MSELNSVYYINNRCLTISGIACIAGGIVHAQGKVLAMEPLDSWRIGGSASSHYVQ